MLYERIADALVRPVQLDKRVVAIDASAKSVTFTDGTTTAYDQLVTTMPLKELVKVLADSDATDTASLLAAEVDGRKVSELVDENSAALGEKIEVGRVAKFTGGGHVVSYLHKTSPDLPPQLGVLVELDREHSEVGRDVAQHIAAFSPSYLERAHVPADVVENERRIAEATAREEGKPEAALAKIVEGRVSGFYKDSVLVEQAFAKDNKKSVKQVLDEAGVGAVRFARFRVGQS